jgi:hypothetical protein
VPEDASDRARELIVASEAGSLALQPGEDLAVDASLD